MDDEELQAIRAQRMAQLQNQYGVCVHVATFIWDCAGLKGLDTYIHTYMHEYE